MEKGDHWVFECDIEIKSEPDDLSDEFNETETSKPKTSSVASNDKNTFRNESFNYKIEVKESEISSEQDYEENKFDREPSHIASKSNIDSKKLLEPCSCVIGNNPSTLLVSQQPSKYKPDDFEGKLKLYNHKRKLIKHNLLKFWTDEEQKKLDDLLIQFPPEEVEDSRWEKIAKHLENRTPRQVACRVRYLKMLIQKGKFVPGKIPGIEFNQTASTEIPRYSHGSNIMQYWTPAEQTRLEELLIQFPPEKHEFQRWKKIANCLGNRTPVQVGARAKNYFVMLKRYGIPVPGKMPRTIRRLKLGRKRSCKAFRDSKKLLDSYQPPSSVKKSIESEMDTSGKGINQQLELTEKALQEKQSSSGLAHIGYK